MYSPVNPRRILAALSSTGPSEKSPVTGQKLSLPIYNPHVSLAGELRIMYGEMGTHGACPSVELAAPPVADCYSLDHRCLTPHGALPLGPRFPGLLRRSRGGGAAARRGGRDGAARGRWEHRGHAVRCAWCTLYRRGERRKERDEVRNTFELINASYGPS
jgi:hypothetical protein